jgi:hypothetical protein
MAETHSLPPAGTTTDAFLHGAVTALIAGVVPRIVLIPPGALAFGG